jgi:hypothetical protein
MIGIGATLKYESGSGYIPIPKMKMVNFPDFAVAVVDTHNLDNTDYAKTFEPGSIDPDTITFQCSYSSATYNALVDLIREIVPWRIESPEEAGDQVDCDGFLTSFKVNWSHDDNESVIDGTIKMTGMPQVS